MTYDWIWNTQVPLSADVRKARERAETIQDTMRIHPVFSLDKFCKPLFGQIDDPLPSVVIDDEDSGKFE